MVVAMNAMVVAMNAMVVTTEIYPFMKIGATKGYRRYR